MKILLIVKSTYTLRLLFLLVLKISFFYTVQAQDFSIDGQVDDKNGNPKSGVSVYLHYENETIFIVTKTGDNGKYEFKYKDVPKVKISAKKPRGPNEPYLYAKPELILSKPDVQRNIIVNEVNTKDKKIARYFIQGWEYQKNNSQFKEDYLAEIKSINPSDFPDEFQERIYQEKFSARLEKIEASITTVTDAQKNTEENNQRLSGQIDEIIAVSNAAGGGTKAAQETAAAAIQGVNATNERILNLDEFIEQENLSINFEAGSSNLTPQSKKDLDEIAAKILKLKGYLIEVFGFADGGRNDIENVNLSQQRVETVVRYLTGNYEIPIRRFTIPIGYGESRAIDSTKNKTNTNRVFIKIMVNRGVNNK